MAGLVHLLGQGCCQEFMFMDGPYEVSGGSSPTPLANQHKQVEEGD
jgi:hypothetical protein